jgi:hypothetical protein
MCKRIILIGLLVISWIAMGAIPSEAGNLCCCGIPCSFGGGSVFGLISGIAPGPPGNSCLNLLLRGKIVNGSPTPMPVEFACSNNPKNTPLGVSAFINGTLSSLIKIIHVDDNGKFVEKDTITLDDFRQEQRAAADAACQKDTGKQWTAINFALLAMTAEMKVTDSDNNVCSNNVTSRASAVCQLPLPPDWNKGGTFDFQEYNCVRCPQASPTSMPDCSTCEANMANCPPL